MAGFQASAAAGIALVLCAACGPLETTPPNVLLVTLDTTRADRLGCYGDAGASTPTLDRIAHEGALFDLAVSTSGLTPMSHASILTGRNPDRHGVRVFDGEPGNRLAEGIPTLASLLHARGWQTGAWVSSFALHPRFGLDRGFDAYDAGLAGQAPEPGGRRVDHATWVEERESSTQRRGDATTDALLGWLDGRAAEPERPWLAWVHYFDVHDFNLVPPAEFAELHGLAYDPDAPRNDAEARETMFALELAYVDQQLARVIERLERLGAWDDTLVVVVADHGQGLGDGQERHGWARHRVLYQWCLRVPLLVRGPGVVPGTRVDELVRTIDLLPTVLQFLGEPVPPGVEGRSLWSLLRGGEEDAPRIAYAEALSLSDERSPRRQLPEACRDDQLCAIDGRWKLILNTTRPETSQLFDLQADPGELRDVSAHQPRELARLRAGLEARAEAALGGESVPLGEDERESLGELGYLSGDEEETHPEDSDEERPR